MILNQFKGMNSSFRSNKKLTPINLNRNPSYSFTNKKTKKNIDEINLKENGKLSSIVIYFYGSKFDLLLDIFYFQAKLRNKQLLNFIG